MDQDQPRPDSQPDEDDESAAERKLFDRLLDATLANKEFADAVTEYQVEADLTAHLVSSRGAIWGQVAVQRLRVRDTRQQYETILNEIRPAAEESIRQSRPDLVKGEADLNRALDELSAGAQAVEMKLDSIRVQRQLEESQRARTRVTAMVHEVEQAIDQLDGLLDKGPEAPRPAASRRGRFRIRSPRWLPRRAGPARSGRKPAGKAPAEPATSAELTRRYNKHLEDLNRVRGNISEVATARKRIELQISAHAEQIVRNDEALRELKLQAEAAQTELDAALGEALCSEVRQYMNQHAFQAFDVHLQVVEATGLYQSLPDSDVVETLAIGELERTLLRMSGASIGIAGPRGAGKSTAINYLYAKFRLAGQANPDRERTERARSRYLSRSPDSSTYYTDDEERYYADREDSHHPYAEPRERAQPRSGDRPHFYGTVVSAPVKYSPREFVLHLFAELCRDIAGPDADRRITPVERAEPVKAEWVTLTVSAAALVAGAIAALITVCLDPTLVRPAAIVTLCNSIIAAGCIEFFTAPQRSFPISRYVRHWQRFLARRTIVISSLAFIAAGLAITGIVAVPGTLGRTLWTIGFCGFVIISLIPAVSAPSEPSAPRPMGVPAPRRSRLRRLRDALQKTVTLAARTATARIWSPGFSAMTAGSIALLALRFPPRNAVVFLSGCVALLIAAAAFIPLSDLRSQYRQSARAGSGTTGTEEHREQAVILSLRFSNILKMAAAVMVLAGYSLIRPSTVLPVAAVLLPGSVLVVLGVIALNTKWTAKSLEVATDIPHWPSEQLMPPSAEPVPVRHEDDLADIALQYLRDIRFQQSFSTDRNQSWTLASPGSYLSLSSQRTWGTSWSGEPRTLPEIVARLRDFIMIVHGRGHRLIVGIDELDKLSEAEAQGFLNDIKAIFGIRGCNFIVSVSEDAAADFERRGVPFRSAFDSSFDDIISIGYFDRTTAATVLEGRITGLFRPFILLCHALSGGLARDLVRIARELLADAGPSETLGQAAHRLCRAELEAKTQGICRQLARMDVNPWASELVADILGDGAPPRTAADHLDRCTQLHSWIERVAQSPAGASDTKALDACQRAEELASYACFTGTVLEFFAEYLTESRMNDLTSGFSNPRSIERLAASRQAMAASPRQAMRYLTDFRESWQLASLPAASA